MSAAPDPRPLTVLNVVGLTPDLLQHAPSLRALADGGFSAPLGGVFPAVTCTAQATMTTGRTARDHGIVGNGWYFRDLNEVWLWRQSNRLVQAEQVWEALKSDDPAAITAVLFWWYNMATRGVDLSATPRPGYHSDGRKSPDIHAHPPELKSELTDALGTFPLFRFWGPAAGIESSAWIADAAVRVIERRRPRLAMVYLPHLDYDLQRHGPDSPEALRAVEQVDAVAARVLAAAHAAGHRVCVVSEYGIEAADGGPVAVNRVLRRAGLFETRDDPVGELPDWAASRAFAVADHQCAHVYVRDPDDLPRVREVLEDADGIAAVLDDDGKREVGLDHERSGELVLEAEPGRWFSHHWWLDDDAAPEFAGCVDIHRKPGYDPAELLTASGWRGSRLRIAWLLFRKALGFRYSMNVVPLDGRRVGGTHGRRDPDPRHGPILIGPGEMAEAAPADGWHMTDLRSAWLRLLGIHEEGS